MSPEKIFLTVDGRSRSLAWLLKNVAAATDVWVYNCPGLSAQPDLPAATVVRVYNCPGLSALPDLPAATVVRVDNCPGLSALPDLPAATDVRVDNCPGLSAPFVAGKDKRGYLFTGFRIRGQWRIIAGCRNLSIPDARKHWGPKGESDRPDCLALVEAIAAAAERIDARNARGPRAEVAARKT